MGTGVEGNHQLRARHPDWGIIPGDGHNLWQAIRTGYPGLVATDASSS